MRRVAMLCSRVWRRVCGPQMLAADAASIRRGPRSNVRSLRLGPPAHSLGWTPIVTAIPRRCLPYTPPAVGVPRRKPPRAPGSVHRAGARFELDASRPTGWLPAHALRQRRTSRLYAVARAAVPSPSCGWGRTGAWTAPRCRRLPRRCGNPPGGGCAFASAQAPACAARHLRVLARRRSALRPVFAPQPSFGGCWPSSLQR